MSIESRIFVEVMEVGGEWFVRVVAEDRETIDWFQIKSRALDFAEGWRKHLNLNKTDFSSVLEHYLRTGAGRSERFPLSA